MHLKYTDHTQVDILLAPDWHAATEYYRADEPDTPYIKAEDNVDFMIRISDRPASALGVYVLFDVDGQRYNGDRQTWSETFYPPETGFTVPGTGDTERVHRFSFSPLPSMAAGDKAAMDDQHPNLGSIKVSLYEARERSPESIANDNRFGHPLPRPGRYFTSAARRDPVAVRTADKRKYRSHFVRLQKQPYIPDFSKRRVTMYERDQFISGCEIKYRSSTVLEALEVHDNQVHVCAGEVLAAEKASDVDLDMAEASEVEGFEAQQASGME